MVARNETALYGCEIKELPESEWLDAAITAIDENPINAPDPNLPRAMIGVATTKYFGPATRTLSTQFLDGPDAATRRMILEHMNAWSTHPRYPCGIKFAETAGTGEIRISRAATGYWSYLGTDCLRIPVGQATMNLQGFTARTPVSEYMRVVQHETGHTLGCPHEHARAAIVALLDRQKVYDHFQRTQGWTRDAIDQQILTPLEERTLMATPPDVDSIMTYQFPGSLTLSGRPIPGGLKINDSDAQHIAKMYPSAIQPPPPTGSWTAEGTWAVTCGHCGHKAAMTPVIKAV